MSSCRVCELLAGQVKAVACGLVLSNQCPSLSRSVNPQDALLGLPYVISLSNKAEKAWIVTQCFDMKCCHGWEFSPNPIYMQNQLLITPLPTDVHKQLTRTRWMINYRHWGLNLITLFYQQNQYFFMWSRWCMICHKWLALIEYTSTIKSYVI